MSSIGLDLRVEGLSGAADVDLDAEPPRCSTCPDVRTHARLAAASLCDGTDEARQVMQMLGLVESPPPPSGARTRTGRSRKPSTAN